MTIDIKGGSVMIDITKPVRTKDGREVKKLSYLGEFIVGLVDNFPHFWALDGNSFEIGMDIENVPEPRYVWMPVYDSGDYYFNSLALAKQRWPSAAHILRVNRDTGEAVKEEV